MVHRRNSPQPRARQKRGETPVLAQPVSGTSRLLGYARVSRDDQNLAVQLEDLRRVGIDEANTFVEMISAVNAHRPQFNLMLKMAEPGDTIVFHSLSRFGRDALSVLSLMRQLAADNISWRSLSEPYLEDKTAMGQFVVMLTTAKDQLERGQLIERTKRGMATAIRSGMYIGRKRIVTKEVEQEMRDMRWRKKIDVKVIARKFKIKPSTVYANTKR